jgi:hypothetical protein
MNMKIGDTWTVAVDARSAYFSNGTLSINMAVNQ